MSSNKSFGGLGGLVNKFAGGSTTKANANASNVSSGGTAPIDQVAAPVNHIANPSASTTAPATTPAVTSTTASTGQQDYGDKAFAFIAKKSGHNIDAKTSEKITDGARGLFEKVTGKKVSSKISN